MSTSGGRVAVRLRDVVEKFGGGEHGVRARSA